MFDCDKPLVDFGPAPNLDRGENQQKMQLYAARRGFHAVIATLARVMSQDVTTIFISRTQDPIFEHSAPNRNLQDNKDGVLKGY